MEDRMFQHSDKEKLDRFIKKINKLIAALHEDTRSRNFQKDYTNQFYYMTKREELYGLLERVEEAERDLAFYKKQFMEQYSEVFHRWQHDARKMQRNRADASEPHPGGNN